MLMELKVRSSFSYSFCLCLFIAITCIMWSYFKHVLPLLSSLSVVWGGCLFFGVFTLYCTFYKTEYFWKPKIRTQVFKSVIAQLYHSELYYCNCLFSNVFSFSGIYFSRDYFCWSRQCCFFYFCLIKWSCICLLK